MKIRHFYSVRFQTAGSRLVERTHYMIHWWRTHGGEWPSSRSAGYYKIHKLIRCLFIHYGSIFQMHDPWPYPEDLCHFSPSHPKSWVSLNKWRKSQSYIDYRCSNSVFQLRENNDYHNDYHLRLIKRKNRQKIAKSCLYDNLIIFDLKNGRPSSPDT